MKNKNFTNFLYWKKKIEGNEKIVIDNKFKEYVPICDKICIVGKWFERLNTIKFHGKPPRVELLKNSIAVKIIKKAY